MLVMVEGKKEQDSCGSVYLRRVEKWRQWGKQRRKSINKRQKQQRKRRIAKTKNSRSLVAQPNSLFTGGLVKMREKGAKQQQGQKERVKKEEPHFFL